MSKDFRHGQNQRAKTGKAKWSRAERALREDKGPSEQYYKDSLRHAVKLQDLDAFEDYDEHPTS